MSYTICVEGDPVRKQRPRFTKGGGVYTPKETVDYEASVGWEWRKAQHPCLDGPLVVYVDVFENAVGRRKPADLDNYVKAALDALNGLAWADDVQVERIHARIHRNHPHPRMEIEVGAADALFHAQSP